jgi:hypothetical protein
VDRDWDFGFIPVHCLAARGTSRGGRWLFGQASVGNGRFSSKAGWHSSRYTAFSGNCFWFCRSIVGTEVFPSDKTPLDALYVSFFVMGFTDYSPKSGYGQLVVIAQLISGVLLLAALFPIHISRISTFKSP